MSLFSYEAIDARGRRQRGEIEADSAREARQLLKARQLLPREIRPVAERQRGAASHAARRLSQSDTVLFLQQLGTLLEAGMPLAEALASIADGFERARSRQVVLAVRQQVLEGESLARALRGQGFDEIVCNMVAAGEETGQLTSVALRLAELLERRASLRQELMSATLYPAIVLGFGVLVMLFLLAVVVPQVITVFERSGGELPTLTRAVIAISTGLRDHGGWMLLALIGAVGASRLAMRWPAVRARRDRWLLASPMIGTLMSAIETARFCRTLGMLLAGGVPVLDALRIANQGLGLEPLRRLGEQAREQVHEGGSLARALDAGGLMPRLAVRLIRVGEESGRLESMLLKAAEHFEGEVSRKLKRMLTVLEPLLVLVMAVGVGALALAILLPIAQMNELVR